MTTTRTTKTSLHSFNKTRSSSLTISTQNLLPPFPVMISWESQLHITIPTKYVFASLKHKKYYKINSQTRFKTTKLSCSYGNNCPPKTLVKNFPKRLPPIGPLAGRLANMGFFPALMSFSLLTITRLSVLTVQHRRPYQPGIVAELR
mgnify:CR=1 FL=1